MFKVLNQKQRDALTPDQLAKYDAEYAAYVRQFRSVHGKSQTIKMAITSINADTNANGKVAVITTGKGFPGGNTVFTFAPGQLDNMASQVDCGDAHDLKSLIVGTTEASYLVLEVEPVLQGEEYTQRDGSVGIYSQPHVRVQNSRIELSAEAKEENLSIAREIRIRLSMEKRSVKGTAFRMTTTTIASNGQSSTATPDEDPIPGLEVPEVEPADEAGAVVKVKN